jgi:hypothetical protein
MSPADSAVVVDDVAVECRAGWAFRMRAPRASVVGAVLDDRRVLSWGVHGWWGRWLVNGSSAGIVRIDLDPPVRASTLRFPIRVRELRVSVEDPEGLVAALLPTPGPAPTRHRGASR